MNDIKFKETVKMYFSQNYIYTHMVLILCIWVKKYLCTYVRKEDSKYIQLNEKQDYRYDM